MNREDIEYEEHRAEKQEFEARNEEIIANDEFLKYEREVRESIIKAGRFLSEQGLVARTWGNISARLTDDSFVITPSGKPYDELKPEDLVVVKSLDCSYEGDIKPSSEKGIHADAYNIRKDINFVVHTHQFYASVIGVEGEDVLMPFIPNAEYGMPSTGKLRKAVADKVVHYPSSDMFLMRRHGALCMGKTMDEALDNATELEKICEELYREKVDISALEEIRSWNVEMPTFIVKIVEEAFPGSYAIAVSDPEIIAVAEKYRSIRPAIDDLAQIAGAEIVTVQPVGLSAVKGLKGRNAVLVKGYGAICTGETLDDAKAAAAILRKNCASALYTESGKGLNIADSLVQRAVYVFKYSKLAHKEK